MVSSRGVAKKRRKQEVAGVVNQMFAYCCGHATIVARRQPLSGYIEPCLSRPTSINHHLARPHPGGLQPVGDRKKNFSNARFAAPYHATKLNRATAQASPRIAKRNSNRIPAADDRSIPPACDARIEVTMPDINRVRKGSRHFCAAGTVCACFSSREDVGHHVRSRRSNRSYARQNNIVRNLSQRFLIAVGNEARA